MQLSIGKTNTKMDTTADHGTTIINKGVDPTAALLSQKSGLDPALMAMLQNQGGGLGGNNSMIWILLLLFSRGGLGGFGQGGDALAASAITSAKDVSQQLNTFQSWAASNAQQLATQLCTSTASITAAVNALTPQMFQSFAALTQSTNQGFSAMQLQHATDAAAAVNQMNQGFAAASADRANQFAAVNLAACNNTFSLSKQLAECCCENRLAIANQNSLIERNTAQIQKDIALQSCELKTTIHEDGQATRSLIEANRIAMLQQELADAKVALSNCQQTGNFSNILNVQAGNIISAVKAACTCCDRNGNSSKN
jgi:hypothetical protein